MTSGSDLLNNYGLSQGFTGHEQDDEFGFINMRGRLYDPNLGRFLSADPFVQAPTNTQSYNRYSYVLNNPPSYTDTDPSGYLFSGLKKFVKENIRTIVALATVMVAPQSLMQLIAWNAVTSAALTYSKTGSWKTAAYAGLMSGVTTGLSAGLAGAVSNAIPVDGLARTIAHGVAQGTVSVLQGGKFGHGFISGSIGHAAKGLGTRLGFGQVGSEQGLMARTMVSALVGGTVSQLTGGKFANGAMTAAFVHLFNAEMSAWDKIKNYSYRTVAFAGGAAQAALGGVLCETVVGCVFGAPIIGLGASNMYEAWYQEDDYARKVTRDLVGRKYGDAVYAGVNFAVSAGGFARPIPRRATLDNYPYMPSLMGRNTWSDYEMAIHQTGKSAFAAEGLYSAEAARDAFARINMEQEK